MAGGRSRRCACARSAPTRSPSWHGRSTRWPASLAATLTTLRSERDLLGLILQSMQEGVLVLDAGGPDAARQPGAARDAGAPADAEGRAALELIRNAELQSILERAQRGGGPVTGEIETTGPRPRRLLVHAASLPPVNGKPQGLLAVFVDVSEIRRLETLRKDFVANVSHELRTPITAVRSAVDTLRLTLTGDPAPSRTVRRHHRPQRPAAGRAGRGSARSVPHRVQGLPPRGEAGGAAHASPTRC